MFLPTMRVLESGTALRTDSDFDLDRMDRGTPFGELTVVECFLSV
jgi:hypothetical protein